LRRNSLSSKPLTELDLRRDAGAFKRRPFPSSRRVRPPTTWRRVRTSRNSKPLPSESPSTFLAASTANFETFPATLPFGYSLRKPTAYLDPEDLTFRGMMEIRRFPNSASSSSSSSSRPRADDISITKSKPPLYLLPPFSLETSLAEHPHFTLLPKNFGNAEILLPATLFRVLESSPWGQAPY